MRFCTVDAIRSAADGEEDSRRFILSFSSEEPYTRWFGPEILDHSDGSMDLNRLNSIGVILFNHDTSRVCGKIIRAWSENLKGYAEVEFDSDDDAELIYQKVKSRTLKATSVRYAVDVWEEVAAGKTSSNGRHMGPCSVAVKWTPLEVSIVSVPADATVGVGRSHESSHSIHNNNGSGRSIAESQLRVNNNYIIFKGDN